MFTGIVAAIGAVQDVRAVDGGLEMTVSSPWDDIALGESIAVDGACLTASTIAGSAFGVHVVRTSIDRTGFGRYAVGRQVNLERAMRAGDRFGGHLVQGHVDGLGTVERITQRSDARVIDIRIPAEVAATSILLGSITIDGVALTVNAIVAPGLIQVSLIPFTLEHTTLGGRLVGDPVHVEGDMVGKYLKQLSAAWQPGAPE